MPTESAQSDDSASKWWKGNLHTHTFWSDGDDFPEMVVKWYKDDGYDFLSLSDHNILSQGQKWKTITPKQSITFDKYLKQYGDRWVETKANGQNMSVRLKPLNEFRCLFEEPGEFLLIQAEEITERVHLNAINSLELIKPQGGKTTVEKLQNNVNAVLAQREKTGQLMIPHVNHPNFQWAITAEDLMVIKGMKFFEIYNAHGSVNNPGDINHAGTERMWDIILTKRLTELDLGILYGIGTDDAHNYHHFANKAANPGQAWVMVRSSFLTPESILKAMETGDFYTSTGVLLRDISDADNTLSVQVDAEDELEYTIQFIGTRKGYDKSSKPVVNAEGKSLPVTRTYSDEIGTVLAQVKGARASYTFKGDEIYVRAKVISSRPDADSHIPGEFEAAWVQPVIPGK
ncbi:MAG: histidinol-phosphatase [Phycisphaerae bacterium]|nr:histidinol-phosphatase [Phycisphaerae bacterium]